MRFTSRASRRVARGSILLVTCALTTVTVQAEIVASFSFDNPQNPVENAGTTDDGVLRQGAAVLNGRLHVAGLGPSQPGGLPDAGMAIPLGDQSPFSGDESWRLSLDFITLDDEGPLFSADGSLPAFGLDCSACPGDQAGGLNVFLREGVLNADFWYLGVATAGENLNDARTHTIDLLFTHSVGTLEIFVDNPALTGAADNSSIFTINGNDRFFFSRDASQDVTLLGDESTADEDFAFHISDDGFDGSFDNLVVERYDYVEWAVGESDWLFRNSWDPVTLPNAALGHRVAITNGGRAQLRVDVPNVQSLIMANKSNLHIFEEGSLGVQGIADVYPSASIWVNGKSASFSSLDLDIEGEFIGTDGSITNVERNIDVRSGGNLDIDGSLLNASRIKVDATMAVRNGGFVEANAVVQSGGRTILDNGQIEVNFFDLRDGTLEGVGEMIGELVSTGLVRPGFSPGIIEIDGDYTQENSGVLEIEIGGLEPGEEHDQLIISGSADLAGRLDVPILDEYQPSEDDEIVFLTTEQGLFGNFDVITSPNLGGVAPELAIEVTIEDLNARLRFVPIAADNEFQGLPAESNWADMDIWSSGNAPNSTNQLNLLNQTNEDQRLEIAFDDDLPGSGTALVHSLAIGGDDDTLTVAIGNGSSLSATTNVAVGNSGILELNNGTVLSAVTEVAAGGIVQGNGTVVGDLVIGTTNGAGTATLSPGFSVGSITVEGDYRQTESGTLVVEIEGQESFDTLNVTGMADLGGSLEVVVTDANIADPGTLFEVVTADSIGDGIFSGVTTTGVDEIYFAPVYPAAAVGGEEAAAGASLFVGLFDKGDMNQDGLIDESDIVEFSLGLSDPEAFFSGFFVEADIAGDVDFDGDQDFDDIDEFAELISSMSFGQVLAAIQGREIPEPTTAGILIVGGFLLLAQRRRPGSYRYSPDHLSGQVRR